RLDPRAVASVVGEVALEDVADVDREIVAVRRALVSLVRVVLVRLHREEDRMIAGEAHDHDLALREPLLDVGPLRRLLAHALDEGRELAHMALVVREAGAELRLVPRLLDAVDR